jgi:hypothetical protein
MDRSGYWSLNRGKYQAQDMRFDGVASIVSYRGPYRNGQYAYQEEYDSSTQTLRQLIHDQYSRSGYQIPDSWFSLDSLDLLWNVAKVVPQLKEYWSWATTAYDLFNTYVGGGGKPSSWWDYVPAWK